MRKVLAIFLVFVFSLANFASVVSAYKKISSTSITLMEEDETHEEVMEVKEVIKQDEHPFVSYEYSDIPEYSLVRHVEKVYEDVHLKSIETPPDFFC